MPFRVIVRSTDSTAELRDVADSERPMVEQIIAEFRAGELPMEAVLTVWHAAGAFRRRWADIKDIWIEEP